VWVLFLTVGAPRLVVGISGNYVLVSAVWLWLLLFVQSSGRLHPQPGGFEGLLPGHKEAHLTDRAVGERAEHGTDGLAVWIPVPLIRPLCVTKATTASAASISFSVSHLTSSKVSVHSPPNLAKPFLP
jgi:hypothetical protein